ncbi:exocyst complex component EXO70B1-like [Salvia divinorum]|uniref:Exocyst subunit Exo70 family protein n=1 Tax=Salvia divinorum TaxID=28513 RepID=A0ABD1G4K2_SALDI
MGSSLSLSQQSAVDTINQWRSRPRHELIFDSGRREISQYLQAIDKLDETNARGSNDRLISTAMDRLRSEFDAVLRRCVLLHPPGPISTTEWSSSDSTANAFRYEDYVLADAFSDDIVDFLTNVAARMNSRGKIEDCVRVYKSVRKPYLQSQLKRLRFDELRGDHNQRRYVQDELKVKMELWIQVSKICVRILFEKERKLCDRIFGNVAAGGGGDNDIAHDCFVGTVKDSAVLLFRFAEDLSQRRQPYAEMGAVLGVYEAFLWVLPDAQALFASAPGKGIRDVCSQAYSLIQDDAVRMLYDLHHDILHEAIASDEHGGVHSTTEFVVGQIEVVVKNKNLLTGLIRSAPSLNFGDAAIPQEELRRYANSSGFLEQYLVLTILVLLSNLKTKSKSYRDPCLGHLFTMNNLRCILKGIEASPDLQEMVGARLIAKMRDDLASARASYETTTCDKFLTCLRDDGIYTSRCCLGSRPSKAAVRRRLSSFNDVYEKVDDLHSHWKIPDLQLRNEVRLRMSEILVPRYRKFIAEFGSKPETKLVVEGNMRHRPEDLEVLVQQKLFANSDS